MAKKNINHTSDKTTSDEMAKLVRIILILVVIAGVFYGITVLVTKNKKNDSKVTPEKTPAVIQYDEIILGTLFSQSDSEYYVLIEDMDSPYKKLFDSYMTSYRSKDGALRVYTSDLNSIFNSMYRADGSNLEVDNLQNLKISGPALLKVKDRAVKESYQGIDAIEGAFKELVK